MTHLIQLTFALLLPFGTQPPSPAPLSPSGSFPAAGLGPALGLTCKDLGETSQQTFTKPGDLGSVGARASRADAKTAGGAPRPPGPRPPSSFHKAFIFICFSALSFKLQDHTKNLNYLVCGVRTDKKKPSLSGKKVHGCISG